jgi:M6 family metalloprotease-like protein
MNILWAISSYPGIINVFQPDGTPIDCFIKGDEWANWHETPDGWSIIKNDNDIWVYAEGVNGIFLLPGNKIVNQDPPPQYIKKHLKPDPVYRPIHRSNINLNISRTDTFRIPVIYFQFPDQAVTYPVGDIDNLFNQEGYGHPGFPESGSFREFYEEISYNQFSPNATIVGVFTAPNNHDYYGSDGPNYGTRVRQLVRAMVDSAEAAGFDWSQFDNDGDGDVDGVTLVHSGLGAEQGDGSNIWSHRWSLGDNAVTNDGVLINDYNINPEMQGTNITAIGVLAHEFGHVLGLPDLYDTDYSSSGAGKLALMASGSWGTSGNTPWFPSSMNAWSKTEMGWSNVIIINSGQTNVELEQSFTNNTIYLVAHPYDISEYWLIENRRKRGTDHLMPQPGILFWHIDTEKTSGWGVNTDEPHYGVGLEQADGLFELENDGASDGGDPYPGLTDNREFTHCSTPSTVSYYFEPSMIAFTNISNSDSIMSFDISFDDVETGSMSAVGFGDAYAVGYLSISMTNNIVINEFSFELTQHPGILSIQSIELSGRASADTIIVTGNLIELVNPNIPSGSGEILMLTVFANTGSDGTVNINADNINTIDDNGNIVCLIFDGSTYIVNPITQSVSMDSTNASAGGTGLVGINVHNNIPLKMFLITVNNSPDYLTPFEESFTDGNQNGQFDEGEIFTDLNGDGDWTPIVQTTVRTASWDLSYQINDAGIMVAGLNSIDSIAIGDGPIFKINYLVDNDAPTTDISMIFYSVNLTDIFGNYNLQYESSNSVFVVTGLSTENEEFIPKTFSMSANFPNPFNPVTYVNFDVPEQSNVSFTIYSLLGQEVMSMTNEYQPGTYKLSWNGRDGFGNSVPSGVYILQMTSEGFTQSQKLLLLK